MDRNYDSYKKHQQKRYQNYKAKQEFKKAMNRPDPSKGLTNMIVQEIDDKLYLTNGQMDKIQAILFDLSIAEIQEALIAGNGFDEVISVLDVGIENGKHVKYFDPDGNQLYPVKPQLNWIERCGEWIQEKGQKLRNA